MSYKGDSFMRLFVFFDLPVKTKQERKIANDFRKRLVKDGYNMLQLSIYCRICNGQDLVDKHIRRLHKFVPPEGNVRILQVTDKQYGRMHLLVGKRKKEEEIGTTQLVLF